ncbi:50S ribosomal protein L11 methyltransferase [Actinomycetospora endophytica]|uniref:50S ribosomal protein L11 methyltransferase n=1 Tax=Actinomycetospora endophytica TaxID=2291215 RepID=A0ABS8PI40_9PSEU|nr:50S ribosomal protein L11 methyltransferase [Actinomycetospora endophytica]MCD2196659.1 50S ribosomal protein L11 methyltransferase [Actinomycetospora endophytica]
MTAGDDDVTAGGSALDAEVTSWTAPGAAPLVPEVTLLLADDIHRTWSQTDEEAPPFWAFAWAGGQALARHVLDRPEIVAGRRVLDLAAGSGIVGIAAAKAGAAAVVASDSDARARVATARNAALNGVTLDVVGDLVGDEAEDVELDVDVVLAGDVFYEQPMARLMGEFLDEAVAAGVEVLVGDPGREYLPRKRVTQLASYDVPETADLEGRAVTPTAVHRLT